MTTAAVKQCKKSSLRRRRHFRKFAREGKGQTGATARPSHPRLLLLDRKEPTVAGRTRLHSNGDNSSRTETQGEKQPLALPFPPLAGLRSVVDN